MENLSLKNWLSNNFRERFKKRFKFIIFITSLTFSCFSQNNLVPNPGFEQYDTCPNFIINPVLAGGNAICNAIPWFQPRLPNASPSTFGCGGSSSDFYHKCSGNIPFVWSGFDFQYPYSGEGFSGINLGGPPPHLREENTLKLNLRMN